MSTVPNEWLVSKNARDRYRKWKQDLQRVESQTTNYATPTLGSMPKGILVHGDNRARFQRDHTTAILTATWNEGQPDSPVTPGTSRTETEFVASSDGTESIANSPSPLAHSNIAVQKRPKLGRNTLGHPSSVSPKKSFHLHASKRQKILDSRDIEPADYDTMTSDELNTREGTDSEQMENRPSSPPTDSTYATGDSRPVDRKTSDQDRIIDTVGAIAIDQYGNMAAASSSGGIGMKHCGRVGPAALVGVSTAVIPYHEQDPDRIMVGAVTSGTGEHMATTMASQKCAERLYQGTRRGDDGYDVKEDDEVAILDSFILKDFQDHTGVRNSTSVGAIGAMVVKKTPRGYYLYFAHNTDSFALASMGSGDRQPHCVMSRMRDMKLGVTQGARRIEAQ
jgi:taspase, threonine aspartase, 1